MGNAASTIPESNVGNAKNKKLVLSDGTDVGEANAAGEAFAQSVRRMHCIFPSCDDEFRDLSSAINLHGRQSEQVKAAALKLDACQKRRTRQFTTMESRCGPAQEAYRLCIQEQAKAGNSGREHECLPVLNSFLDCAERALADDAKS